MDAQEITRALGGSWHGSYGMCLCPVHDDGRTPGLKITDDKRKDDGIDLHCFAGCDWRDVKAVLQERGLLSEFSSSRSPSNRARRQRKTRRKPAPPKGVDIDEKTRHRTAQAREIWHQSQPAIGTMVETYLRSRAIALPPPPSLRFHPDLRYGPTGAPFPAMVAGVQAPDRKITAVHRTYLRPSGTGKAQVSDPKRARGRLGAGAVRLAKAGSVLGLR